MIGIGDGRILGMGAQDRSPSPTRRREEEGAVVIQGNAEDTDNFIATD